MVFRSVLFSVLFLLMTSCGYHFSTVKDTLPGGVRSVSIPTFHNGTKEAAIENVFTSALRKEFFKSKVIKVLEADKAEATIQGKITGLSIDSTAYEEKTFQSRGSKILALEYNTNVSVDITLKRNKDNKILWTRSISDSRRYSSSEDLLKNETKQREAYAKVATYLMEQAHDMMFEDF